MILKLLMGPTTLLRLIALGELCKGGTTISNLIQMHSTCFHGSLLNFKFSPVYHMICLIIVHSQSHPCHSKCLCRGQGEVTKKIQLIISHDYAMHQPDETPQQPCPLLFVVRDNPIHGFRQWGSTGQAKVH
jgi:hypothetical protein